MSARSHVVLDSASIEAIAAAVVSRMAAGAPSPLALLSARELAAQLGHSPQWVRAHAAELGVIRVGTGPRPRLLFDPETARERLASCSADRQSEATQNSTSKRKPRRKPRKRSGASTDLLPVRGGTELTSQRTTEDNRSIEERRHGT